MRTNFHTHTFRCNHCKGTERDMIQAAIANGYSDLGFSDHTAWPHEGADEVNYHMKMAQLPDYFDTIKALREEYAPILDIHLGLECEYFPQNESWLKETREQHGLYLILGNHFDRSERGLYFGRAATQEDAAQYVRMTVQGLSTGMFSYLAHPDLFLNNMTSFEPWCAQACRELCRACKALDIPMEYNMLGARRQQDSMAKGVLGYTTAQFWDIAAEEDVTCILGVDAHDPAHLQDPDFYDQCERFLDGLGIKRVSRLFR